MAEGSTSCPYDILDTGNFREFYIYFVSNCFLDFSLGSLFSVVIKFVTFVAFFLNSKIELFKITVELVFVYE